MKILLTGFNAFGDIPINPSQLIVETIQKNICLDCGYDLIVDILPTEFDAAAKRISGLILRHRPDWVVNLGVAESSTCISLERVALNIDDAILPDNHGDIRSGCSIVPNGPVAYLSTLPLENMYDSLTRQNIPVRYSNHAGTFVCNHVFYTARHEIENNKLHARCGFIHVPLIATVTESSMYPRGGLPLDVMVQGIESCLTVLPKK